MSVVDENSLDYSARLIADEEQIRQALAEDTDRPSSSDWTMNTSPGPFRSVSPVLGNWSSGAKNDSAHCLAAASTRELGLQREAQAVAESCSSSTGTGLRDFSPSPPRMALCRSPSCASSDCQSPSHGSPARPRASSFSEMRGAIRHLHLTMRGGPPQVLAVCSVAELKDVLRFACVCLNRWNELQVADLYKRLAQREVMLYSRNNDIFPPSDRHDAQPWLDDLAMEDVLANYIDGEDDVHRLHTPATGYRVFERAPAVPLPPPLCPCLVLKRRSLSVQLLSPIGDHELVFDRNDAINERGRFEREWQNDGMLDGTGGGSKYPYAQHQVQIRLGSDLNGFDSPTTRAIGLAIDSLCLKDEGQLTPREWNSVLISERSIYPGLENERVHYVVQLKTSGLPIVSFASAPKGRTRGWKWVPTMDLISALGGELPLASEVPSSPSLAVSSPRGFLSSAGAGWHTPGTQLGSLTEQVLPGQASRAPWGLATSTSTPELLSRIRAPQASVHPWNDESKIAPLKMPPHLLQLRRNSKAARHSRLHALPPLGRTDGIISPTRKPLLLRRQEPHPLSHATPEEERYEGFPANLQLPPFATRSFAAAARFGKFKLAAPSTDKIR